VADLFPEMLSGAALAARFCSEPYIWDQFVEWCLDEGYLKEDEEMSRELMAHASKAMWQVRKQIEVQVFATNLRKAMDKEI